MIKFYSFLFAALLLFTISANAQLYPASLEFFNGEIKQGYIEMPTPTSKKIEYSTSPDGPVIKIKTELVSAITVKKGEALIEIDNIQTYGTNYSLLMAKLVKGKVNVYAFERTGQLAGLVIYHVKRANEEKATRFRSLKYKEDMIKYFEDDPVLVKYIQENSAMTVATELLDIVRTYNSR
ncbi:hypothetical protein H8S95_08280 [Pontibacter sp. KCTC 32443]|uniref:hypothetical protein n=1 Tax=Pontibacter TaxID=323449 RepID=UPI00164ECC2F|nr:MULTISPECIES: hypothetical protein [Pontibacter]MBC5774059.1 hypothetical protein [Pontibacter sp. KCTC 32443]